MALAQHEGMWLEAIFTKADLQAVLQQFSPLKLVLGDSGSLLLAEVNEVTLIPDQGIGVVCDATLHWPVLGFDVPVHFRGLTVRVLPIVDEATKDKPLVFRVQIDHTGVQMLPSFIDGRVSAMVNEELQKKHVELSWTFLETLSHEFALPAAIASSASISLIAVAGLVKANGSALGLAVRFETSVKPRLTVAEAVAAAPELDAVEDAAVEGASAPAPRSAPPPRPLPDGFDVRSFVVGSAVSAVAFTALSGLARLFSRDRHRPW
jgi:hypothetical protein